MPHMVIYRGPDGKPGYHQTDEVVDAVAFVERLRNDRAVEHARIFRLEEVAFEFRPYYHVELTGDRSLGASAERRGQDPVGAGDPAPAPAASVAAGRAAEGAGTDSHRGADGPADEAGADLHRGAGGPADEPAADDDEVIDLSGTSAASFLDETGRPARRGLFGR